MTKHNKHNVAQVSGLIGSEQSGEKGHQRGLCLDVKQLNIELMSAWFSTITD